MKLPFYQIDAFTNRLFTGNPAVVIPLNHWLADDTLLSIAQQSNQPITVFYIQTETGFAIRWFTPTSESTLCGHGTLAAAYVIYRFARDQENKIQFESKSGNLTVTVNDDWFTLDFIASQFSKAVPPPALLEGFRGNKILEVYKGGSDYMVVLESEDDLINLDLDIIALSNIPGRGIIVTAPGSDVDFVSRFFAPQSGIDEDPVTGSTHALLAPYWAEKLLKNTLTARQLSTRGGYLVCKIVEGRVHISGQAKLYHKGQIDVG
ncbi:PhzF family phenazine biosynthesis protein [Dyadobacter sp. CY312]|uniref:PhzF family phenazine biosynthesis protein n=1 Tax=Dyadobacter sp. CY312 TaxID=2907303 RepID=UPI001F1B8A02|nr:PhzF family phenazine biosynthesis protein [Dyadobacter sp. CY312]MCE7044212.1 PhzF family phenazine biosynthesis protein [Dyadobacter sp. CY312]